MTLTPARPLAPFQGEDETELGRRPRRNRKQGRRRGQGRRPTKGHRPPKGRRPPQRVRQPHPDEHPRDTHQRSHPRGGRRDHAQFVEHAQSWDERVSEPEYDPYEPLQPMGDPASADLALEGRLRRRRFTSAATVSPNLKIETAEGTRAAVIPLRPGLYLVAEVSEAALNSPNMGGPEVGAIAIATAAMSAARAAMNVRQRRLEQGKEPVVAVLRDKLANGDGSLRDRLASVRSNLQDNNGQGLVARFRDGDGPLRERLFNHPEPDRVRIPEGTPGQLLPEPIPTWAEPEDQDALAGLFGDCRTCRGDCRHCRRRAQRRY